MRAPADLIAYQELIVSVRPDWIIETRARTGGGALFFASVCELIGSGQVLSIRTQKGASLPQHPRITYLTGAAAAPETRDRIYEIVGDGARGMLVICAHHRQAVVDEFELYSPLVPVGSYVVVEDTILNGRPVLPDHGPGPGEAVTAILKKRHDFVPDTRLERAGVSFNAGGFLKRTE